MCSLELTFQMSLGMAPGTEWPLAPGALLGQPLNAFQFSFIWNEPIACSAQPHYGVNQSTASGDNSRICFGPGAPFWAHMPTFRGILGWEPLPPSPSVQWNLSAFRGLHQLLVLGQEASFRMVASWWEVFNSVNNSLAKTYAVEKYQIYGVEEKEKTQISAGFAKNEWYYLCFSKAVGNFCCILRLFLQNVQNKTNTEGSTGEDSSAGQYLWGLEG